MTLSNIAPPTRPIGHARNKRVVPILSMKARNFRRLFGKAFRNIGFAVITDHGIPVEKIQRLREVSRRLHDLGVDHLTQKYTRIELSGQRGFWPYGETAVGSSVTDYKHMWNVGNPVFTEYQNIWPDEIQEFESAVMDMYSELEHLARTLLRALERDLKLPAGYLVNMIDGADSMLRLLFYPKAQPGTVRSGAHTDINLITLLVGAVLEGEEASDEPRYTGLDVCDRAGVWHQVYETQNCIVVNVGDMLQSLMVLLNHLGFNVPLLRSTPHRVRVIEGTGERRLGSPFFVHAKRVQPVRLLDDNRLQDSAGYLFERVADIGLRKANPAAA